MATKLPTPAHRLIRAFIADHRTSWSHGYLYNATNDLNRLHWWLDQRGTALTDADPIELSEYLAERLAGGLKSSTVIGEHTRLRGFYRWAATDPGDGLPYITRNPMKTVRAPKAEDPDLADVPEVAEWEYRALLATCTGRRTRKGDRRALDRRDAAILAMLWHTGMRRGELAGLDYRHVNWDTQMIHLARTKARGRSASRDVFVPDEAMQFLTRYVVERGEHDGALFESISRAGVLGRSRLAANSVHLMLVRRCGLAGTDALHVRAHAFRRGFASAWFDAGGQQVTLETHMGWKHDGRSAARYTRGRASDLAATEARQIAEARRSRLRAVS